jgi:hypothetical protein
MGRRVPAPFSLPAGVVLRQGRWLPLLGGWFAGMKGPAAAVTIGRSIVVYRGSRLSERLIRHELAHVVQWRKAPLTFPFRYVVAHLRHGYRNNPFEIEARRAESAAQSEGRTI